MSDCAANIAAERAVRDYYRDCDRTERAVLSATASGTCEGLSPDVCAITRAVLDLPASERGIAVDSVLIDRDDARAQWLVLLVLRDGTHRSLIVNYPQ